MDEKGRDRHKDAGSDARSQGTRNQSAGVRAPLPGESSSSGIRPSFDPRSSASPLDDSPTLIDLPARNVSDIPIRTISSDAPTIAGVPSGRPASGQIHIYTGSHTLEPGSVVAQRYEIVRTLGVGGMGAVYQANDLELGRVVALKVIRPDLAGNQAIIDRFKQELILATQVTHRNVVRIYDLGESEGMKFITMEFVEGRDLRTVIQERTKLPPAEAVEIMIQVCRALESAHAVGVIHRDLKPQNIMQDVHGRVVVMDFGLARTLGGDGMTQTGALVGTMEYMSPEQALARELDQRSDIFSLGVIFYELLSGAIPFSADSALASLIKRTQERVVPVSELDDTIPGPLSVIVSRCLEREVEMRYQTAGDLLADLEAWQGKRPLSVAPRIAVRHAASSAAWRRGWLAGGVAAAVLAVAGGGYFYLHKSGTPTAALGKTAATPAVTLAVLPFHNASGDPKLDWLGPYLGDVLGSGIGQSAQLRTLSSSRVHQVLSDLEVSPGTEIDADILRHIVDLSGAEIAVSGKFERIGDQIEIDATVQDVKRDRTVPVKVTAASEKDLSAAIDSLADEIRRSLDFSSSQLNELKAQSFKPSSPSIEALRDYSQGVELLRSGRNLDAFPLLQSAVNADPQFALAYSALGQAQAALGHQADAEQSSRRATELANTEGLSSLEKTLIAANHATILDDNKKAVELYQSLAQAMPSNVDVQYALGTVYSDTGDYEKARAAFSAILQSDPKNVMALWQLGVLEFMSGHPQGALDPLSKAEYLTIQSDNKEQHAMILLAMGITYQFLQKPDEALRYFGESISLSEKIGQKRAVAAALAQTGQMQMDMGKSDAALTSYKKSVALFQEVGSNKEAGDTLIDLATLYQTRGANDEALQLFRQARDAGDQNNEALCLSDIAAIHLAKGDTESAFTYFQQALQLGEKIGAPPRIAEPLQGLGDAYSMSGQYDQALASLKRALDTWRSVGNAFGIASAQRQMGIVFGYQSRFGAAVDSIQQSVKAFRDLGNKGEEAATALTDLAEALAKAGRGEEAAPLLDEAEGMAHTLKSDTLLAKTFAVRGEVAMLRGDYGAAQGFFQKALQSASKDSNRDKIIEAKLNLARVAIARGNGAEALKLLRPLVGVDGASDRNISLQCSVALAEALIQTKDYARAEQILQDSAGTAEKAGMRVRLARIYYLQATASRLSGNSGQAWNEYRQALTLFNTVLAEPGAENILRRVDLKAIFDDCNRWVGSAATKVKQ
jgi:tetratricopeptide (TPR) repeat protein/predicted Ser/Thr protein kinase